MGIFGEYLPLNSDQIKLKRRDQLMRISQLRGDRDILVIGADMVSSKKAPISIEYGDLLAVTDLLSNLNGKALDIILETPGGSGETAEDIVRAVRAKYKDVAVIIPGRAKSAGTIIALSANDILMEPTSSLGPIDAQMAWQGKVFSADAFLKGFKRIKEEVANTGVLNKAYIPILQLISPGELENAENALIFAKDLVRNWLVQYKWKNWKTHKSTGKKVTKKEKNERAEEIATQLCDQTTWFTHARSVKMDDLRKMRLLITDYSEDPELADAIRRYHTLLLMTFDRTGAYKIFEAPGVTIERHVAQVQQPNVISLPKAGKQKVTVAVAEYECDGCNTKTEIQANFEKGVPLKPGATSYPKDDKFKCPSCGKVHDLIDLKNDIESQANAKIVI